MAARPRVVKLIVELVTQPCNRMCITGVAGRECPLCVRPIQAVQYVGVFRDVLVVVVVDEFVPKCLAKNDPDNCHEENADQNGFHTLALNTRNGMRTWAALRLPLS